MEEGRVVSVTAGGGRPRTAWCHQEGVVPGSQGMDPVRRAQNRAPRQGATCTGSAVEPCGSLGDTRKQKRHSAGLRGAEVRLCRERPRGRLRRLRRAQEASERPVLEGISAGKRSVLCVKTRCTQRPGAQERKVQEQGLVAVAARMTAL